MKRKIYLLVAAMAVALMGYGAGPQLNTIREQLPKFTQAPKAPAVKAPAPKAPVQKAPAESLDDCVSLNVAEAISTGQALGLGKTSTETYCVEGWVIAASDYNLAYGNQTFWMSTSESDIGQLFEAYQCTLNESGVQVLKGDKVRVTGLLTYFKNGTTHTGDKANYVEIKGGTVDILTKADGDHSLQSSFERINVATALSKASALAEGEKTDVAYHIYGYVTYVSPTYPKRFWITDDPQSTASTNADGAFFVYQTASLEPKVGDLVVVQSKIYNYKGTYETESGMAAQILTPIQIACGTNCSPNYFGDPYYVWQWVGAVENDNHKVYLDYYSSNENSSEMSVITVANGVFSTEYSAITDLNDNTIALVDDAWATVYKENDTYYARATYIGNDGNVYAITMEQPDQSGPQTYNIDCGGVSIMGLGKETNTGNYWWFFYGYDGENYYYFETPAKNTYTPVAYYTSFSEDCGRVDEDFKVLTLLNNGSITVGLSGNTYYLSGTFTDSEGNTYNISMTPEHRPTDAWLEANTNYDLTKNVVLVTKFTGDAAVKCDGVSFIGSYNDWNPFNATEMTLLDGFTDWYVVSTPYTTDSNTGTCKGKPVHADYDGMYDWYYQPAAKSWTWISGTKATIIDYTSSNETDVTYPSAGAYIYKISAWKGGNPCVKEAHNYSFKIYPPACSSADYKPALVLESENWNVLHEMTMDQDNDGTYYYAEMSLYPNDAYSYRERTDKDNIIMANYSDKWEADGSYYVGHDYSYIRNVDYTDANRYKWSKCEEKPAVPSHDYNITLYAPNVCDEVPGIIGDFNSWSEPIAMTPSFDLLRMRMKYTATIHMEEGQGFKIVAMPEGAWDDKTGWDNQIYEFSGLNWNIPSDYEVGIQTDITLEWGDCLSYRFGKCINSQTSNKVVIGAFLPDGVPALGAEVVGTFNNWRQGSEKAIVFTPVPDVSGMYYAVVDAAVATDYFKIRQLNDSKWTNEILYYDESYNNNGDHWRTIQDKEWTFGNMWIDAATIGQLYAKLAPYTSLVDKGILLTINQPTQYKWTKTPKTINISISDFIWQYYTDTEGDWWIHGANDDYEVQLDVINKDPKSPVGSFNSGLDQFLMNFTKITDKKTSTEISIEKAEAIVKISDDVITVTATMVGLDGNYYKVSMGREWPTAKQKETIYATNLSTKWENDKCTIQASDKNHKVSFTLQKKESEGCAGTYGINVDEVLMGTVTIGNDVYTAISGSVKITQEDNKITLTGTILCLNNVEYTLQLQNYEPAVGQATVRILVPTDNNMDISNGVYVWWWSDNQGGQCVAAQSVGSRWYEAKFDVADPFFSFLVVNKDVSNGKWDNAQQTEDVLDIKANNSCFEMEYNTSEGASKWTLFAQDCEAENHDYRLNPSFDDSNTGRLFIDLYANQLAPHYDLAYRIAGSQDNYQYASWDNHGYSSLAMAFNITQDATYEYQFYGWIEAPSGYGYYVTKIYEGTFTIKANTNIPENLQAVANDEKVTFSWTPKGNDTQYYVIEICDKNNYLLFKTDPIIGNSYTTPVYYVGECIWYLRAYDAYDNILSDPSSTVTITKIPDLKPTNLTVSVTGKEATFTWEAPALADKGLIQIIYNQQIIADGVFDSENGLFACSYTFDEGDKRELEWIVYSLISGHDYYSSYGVTGKPFKAETPTYTLDISAGEGGTVNSAEVNGIYEEGTLVNIIATAGTGYSWWKWSDQNEESSRWIKMNKDVTLVAMFKKNDSGQGGGGTTKTYTLKISSAGGGTVNEEVNKTYEEGEVVSIEAKPSKGWEFDKWSDDNTKASRLITMNKDYTLIAYFKTNLKFKVSITAGAGGSVTVDPKLTESEYLGGTKFTIEAKPNSGYQFDKWSDGDTKAKREITITADTELKALFTELGKATLYVEILPNGKSGKVLIDDEELSPLRKEVYVGSTITLKAKPSTGYVFLHFEDGSATITEKEYDVTVTSSKTVYAVFKEEDKEGIEEVQNDEVQSTKVLINGELYILRGGTIYTVQGQVVK